MTELEDLLDPAELDHWSGGPFEAHLVEAACEQVRTELGWHVAPVCETETMRSGRGGPRLVLPTLRLVEVVEVVEVRTDLPDRPLLSWRRGADGVLIRDTGWPRGEDNIRVRLRHGFEQCPASLRPVVVERLRGIAEGRVPGTRSSTRTVGSRTTTTAVTDSVVARAPGWSIAAESILDRYRA